MYNGKSILKPRIIFLVKNLKLIYCSCSCSWPSRLVLPQPKPMVRGRVHHFLRRSLHCPRVWLHRVCDIFFFRVIYQISSQKPTTKADHIFVVLVAFILISILIPTPNTSDSLVLVLIFIFILISLSILILHCEVRVYQNNEVGTLCDGACFVRIASICRSFDPVSRIGRARFLCPLVKLSIKVASLPRSKKKGHNRTRHRRRRRRKKK